MMRFVSAALLLAAFVCSGSAMFAQNGELCETRECQFRFFNPPILKVSPCIELSCTSARIDVVTNCNTIVCIDCDDQFTRFERDCDCKVLSTKDTIPAVCCPVFKENPLCVDGSPLQVKPLGDNCWCIGSHRGGWSLFLTCLPYGADICDDCGCYELECTVRICTVPCEEEKDCCVVICD